MVNRIPSKIGAKSRREAGRFLARKDGGRGKLRSVWWWALLLLPVAVGVVGWLLGFFDVREIVVEGCAHTSEEELSRTLEDRFYGRLIFAVSSVDIEASVFEGEAFPYIDRIVVEKVLPDKIVVKVWDKEPYVCLLGKGMIDSDGETILLEECDDSVPTLQLEGGEIDLDQIGAALRIKAALTQSLIPVSELILLDHGDIVVNTGLTGSTRGWFSTRGYRGITAQSALFIEIYNSSLNKDGRLVKIDVRFDKAYTERAK